MIFWRWRRHQSGIDESLDAAVLYLVEILEAGRWMRGVKRKLIAPLAGFKSESSG